MPDILPNAAIRSNAVTGICYNLTESEQDTRT